MELSDSFDFSTYTGKGVKVAVIDSGIDVNHPDIRNVCGGVGITINNQGQLNLIDNYHDNFGHGTACAGIILKKSPDVQLYSIKIFHDELLETEVDTLIYAIRWAVETGMKIINLSLGITKTSEVERLFQVCEFAKSRHCIVIAADTNDIEKCFPATFSNVIGVVGGRIKDSNKFYFLENSDIEFVAKGDVQRIAWKDKQQIFLERNSFAAPHITGLIAKIVEKYPKITVDEIRKVLVSNALTDNVELINSKKKYIYHLKEKLRQESNEENNKLSWIKKACVFPFNKEMHALIRGKDLLDFSIEAVVDVVGKGTVGKDAGIVIGAKETGILIEHDLEKALNKVDTLILGHTSELEKIKGKSLFNDVIAKALSMGKNIYHLDTNFEVENYKQLKELAEKNNVILGTQKIEEMDNLNEDFIKAANSIKFNIPVVGVFGTSSQQGKFTTQLALRRSLLNEGYKVAQIGTEPHCELFGFDLGFPIGYNALVKWPERYYISFLHYKMTEIMYRNKPDIFVVGAQSNVIPYDINEVETINLGSIAFLLGTRPDAYILTVNTFDSDEYIYDSIKGMESLGQGKTICLTISDKEKQYSTNYGRTSIQYKQLSHEEMEIKKRELEKKFKLPVTDVVSEEGQEKLLNVVIDYFSEKNNEV